MPSTPAFRWISRLFLLAASLQVVACAGVYLPPAANVPALERAGQATVSGSTRIFAPQYGTHAAAAVALTDWLRVAGTFSTSFHDRRGRYGEALIGAEPKLNKLLWLGVLAGAGYGAVDAKHERCPDEPKSGSFCFMPGNHVNQVRATYVRYALQAHAIVRAPKLLHGGGGLRVSLLDMHVHEIDDAPAQRHILPVALEPFAFARIGWPFLQGEVQFRYTGLISSARDMGHRVVAPDHFTIMFGLRAVFGPGIGPRWPRGWRYE